MKRIHRGSDVSQEFTFSTLAIPDVANIYFLVYDPMGNVVKRMAIVEDGIFENNDVEVASDNEVIVRLHRNETQYLSLGRYVYQIRVAYNNVNFEDSVEVRSDSYTSFDIVADYEKTNEGEGIDLNFLVGGETSGSSGGSGGISDAPSDGNPYVRMDGAWSQMPEVSSQMTDEEVKAAFERNADTNTLTDSLLSQIQTNSSKNTYPAEDSEKLTKLKEPVTEDIVLVKAVDDDLSDQLREITDLNGHNLIVSMANGVHSTGLNFKGITGHISIEANEGLVQSGSNQTTKILFDGSQQIIFDNCFASVSFDSICFEAAQNAQATMITVNGGVCVVSSKFCFWDFGNANQSSFAFDNKGSKVISDRDLFRGSSTHNVSFVDMSLSSNSNFGGEVFCYNATMTTNPFSSLASGSGLCLAKNSDGVFQSIVASGSDAVDLGAGVTTDSPKITAIASDIGVDSANITLSSTKQGSVVYGLYLATDTVPTKQEIKIGTGSLSYASVVLPENLSTTESLLGLIEDSSYVIYFYGVDSLNNETDLYSLSFSSTENQGSVPTATVVVPSLITEGSSFSLTVSYSDADNDIENGTTVDVRVYDSLTDAQNDTDRSGGSSAYSGATGNVSVFSVPYTVAASDVGKFISPWVLPANSKETGVWTKGNISSAIQASSGLTQRNAVTDLEVLEASFGVVFRWTDTNGGLANTRVRYKKTSDLDWTVSDDAIGVEREVILPKMDYETEYMFEAMPYGDGVTYSDATPAVITVTSAAYVDEKPTGSVTMIGLPQEGRTIQGWTSYSDEENQAESLYELKRYSSLVDADNDTDNTSGTSLTTGTLTTNNDVIPSLDYTIQSSDIGGVLVLWFRPVSTTLSGDWVKSDVSSVVTTYTESPEMVSNGVFSDSSGWELSQGLTVNGGVVDFDNSATAHLMQLGADMVTPIVPYGRYEVSFDITGVTPLNGVSIDILTPEGTSLLEREVYENGSYTRDLNIINYVVDGGIRFGFIVAGAGSISNISLKAK